MLLLLKKKEVVEKKRVPPGPKKLPIIGNLHQLGQFPHRSLQRLSNEHGPLMFLQLGSVPSLVVSSAHMAKEIFKTNDLIFSSRPVLYVAKKLSYNGSNISFAPYGEYWREVRKIAVLELFSAKRLQSFEAIREEQVSLTINSISSSTSLINLSELLLLLSNNVVLAVVFGKKGNDGDHQENGIRMSKFHGILRETQQLLGMVNIADYFPWMGWFNKLNGVEARLEKNFRELDKFYDKVIEEHLDLKKKRSTSQQREDLVDVLLRLQNDPNRQIRLTNEQIKGVLTDMFIAGTDTSAAALVWILTELIKNPSAMRKAQDEVRRIVKAEKGVKECDVPKLEYLKLVVKEGLRLHPPTPLLIPRETTESCSIGGYEIPGKTRVFINATSISMDPEYWENPAEFKPERFLNRSSTGQSSYELLPFGAGRRGCPGNNFAIMLIELALANLLHSFEWRVPRGIRAEDIDMNEAMGITMHKKTPLCLFASPRNNV